MVSIVNISPACEVDGPCLALIIVIAMRSDLLHTFLRDVPMDTYAMGIRRNLENPKCHVFKASLDLTGEIVGYGIIRYEDGEMEDDKPSWTPPSPPDTLGTNTAFRKMYGATIEAKWKQHMKGKKHVVWDSLFIKPNHQRKGIGTKLLRYGFTTFGLEKDIIFLSTQMRGRNLYRKYGWEDIDNVDIDMSEWGGKYRGFGVHRSPLMVRRPGEFRKLEGIVDE